MTPGRAALVGLMDRYLRGLLDPFVTLLEVHKLLYFMQVAGKLLKLKFAKGPYGPYAENLRYVLNAVEGHLIAGYADGRDAPDKQLELVSGALDVALTFLADRPDTQARFDRVSDLVEGFESSFGLELLATVHWIVGTGRVRTVAGVVERTYAWNERKKTVFPPPTRDRGRDIGAKELDSKSQRARYPMHTDTAECGLERLTGYGPVTCTPA